MWPEQNDLFKFVKYLKPIYLAPGESKVTGNLGEKQICIVPGQETAFDFAEISSVPPPKPWTDFVFADDHEHSISLGAGLSSEEDLSGTAKGKEDDQIFSDYLLIVKILNPSLVPSVSEKSANLLPPEVVEAFKNWLRKHIYRIYEAKTAVNDLMTIHAWIILLARKYPTGLQHVSFEEVMNLIPTDSALPIDFFRNAFGHEQNIESLEISVFDIFDDGTEWQDFLISRPSLSKRHTQQELMSFRDWARRHAFLLRDGVAKRGKVDLSLLIDKVVKEADGQTIEADPTAALKALDERF